MNFKTIILGLCLCALSSCDQAPKDLNKETLEETPAQDTIKPQPKSSDTTTTVEPLAELDPSWVDEVDTTNGCFLSPIDSLEYQKVLDQSLKAIVDSSYIDKKKDLIKLPLDRGREKVFKDLIVPDDETSNEYYHYAGYYEKPQIYYIWKGRYEDGLTFLVQKHNGKITETWDDPQFNPSGNLIFCRQRSCFPVFQDCFKGYQIWKLMGGDLFKINEKIMDNHMVFEAKWKNDHEIVIKLLDIMVFLKTQYETKSGFKYYSLKLAN